MKKGIAVMAIMMLALLPTVQAACSWGSGQYAPIIVKPENNAVMYNISAFAVDTIMYEPFLLEFNATSCINSPMSEGGFSLGLFNSSGTLLGYGNPDFAVDNGYCSRRVTYNSDTEFRNVWRCYNVSLYNVYPQKMGSGTYVSIQMTDYMNYEYGNVSLDMRRTGEMPEEPVVTLPHEGVQESAKTMIWLMIFLVPALYMGSLIKGKSEFDPYAIAMIVIFEVVMVAVASAL